MSARTLAELALKIWGVTLLISSLSALPVAILQAASIASSDGAETALFRIGQSVFILNVVSQGLVGFAVLVWADNVAGLIESDTAPIQIQASTADLQALGFGLVGAFVLVDGLQSVAGVAYVLWKKPDYIDTLSYVWSEQSEQMVRAVVQAVAGAVLVFGRESIAKGWSRLRTSGDDARDDDAENEDGGEGRSSDADDGH